jgi:RNA polymerase sigma factor (sigma-70 family)
MASEWRDKIFKILSFYLTGMSDFAAGSDIILNMVETDLQLLARYARDNAEDAFAEIVGRHLDLVHSAALRQVRSPHLAEEVAQSVFIDLARQARRIAPDTILTAWLYQVTRRSAIDVVRREASRRLREQIATEMNAMNATPADWRHIEPLLDEAMHALDEIDRTAVLLRYFENKSLREVGQTLGTSDDTAQKRVSRAVERLREFFAKRGITAAASGLIVLISANAVQAAPVGLALAISTAATLAGTTLVSSATATVAQGIAMTATQKFAIIATLTAAVGTGIYEGRQASRLRTHVQNLEQQQSSLAARLAEITLDRDNAAAQLAMLHEENEHLKPNGRELLKLRGEVGLLRAQINTNGSPNGGKIARVDNAILALVDLFERTPPGLDRNRIAIALGHIGPAAKEAVPSLLRALNDPNIGVRRVAARALGGIGAEPDLVVPALLDCLIKAGTLQSEEVPYLRQDVSYALGDLAQMPGRPFPPFWSYSKTATKA